MVITVIVEKSAQHYFGTRRRDDLQPEHSIRETARDFQSILRHQTPDQEMSHMSAIYQIER